MLKNLDEHNTERQIEHRRRYDEATRPKLNEIACPKCGAELVDSRPDYVVTNMLGSATPVYCTNCHHRDMRFL